MKKRWRTGDPKPFEPKHIAMDCPACSRRTICLLIGAKARCLHEDCGAMFNFAYEGSSDRGSKSRHYARLDQREHLKALTVQDDDPEIAGNAP